MLVKKKRVSRKCAFSFCGKAFLALPAGHRKYCSRACYNGDRLGRKVSVVMDEGMERKTLGG